MERPRTRAALSKKVPPVRREKCGFSNATAAPVLHCSQHHSKRMPTRKANASRWFYAGFCRCRWPRDREGAGAVHASMSSCHEIVRRKNDAYVTPHEDRRDRRGTEIKGRGNAGLRSRAP
jgi:hypothetical protein